MQRSHRHSSNRGSGHAGASLSVSGPGLAGVALLMLVLLALAAVQWRQFALLIEKLPAETAFIPGEAGSIGSASSETSEAEGEARAMRLRVQHLEDRDRRVGAQNRLGLALTAVLALLTLTFAALALRQMRLLRERRGALEELAQNLRQARQEAEAASKAKSAFLANMSHEIRTPFHGLMGMLSLLREAGLTPRQIDHLRTATESADHLLALLNDILDLSQLEGGHLSLAPAPVSVRALLRDVEALMRPQAAAKNLALHLDADPAVPERVLLDATRVKQIVFNLLSNAIKFSEHGAVVLDVRCFRQPVSAPAGPAVGSPVDSTAAAQLEFIVSDTGIGMDEATLARLFSRFMQGNSTRLRRHGGTGLGLEISRNLARLMGGNITVRSRLGEGSRFTFWLPLHALPDLADPAPSAAAPGSGTPRALRVLVAEDHPVNRNYMAALLEGMGHHAHFTANGEEAVQAARGQRFDVILMDLHMPVLDGVGATQAIRSFADPRRSTVPIVALTADAFPETKDRCLVAGMNDFLTKPVSPLVLATCLRRLFGSGDGAMAGPQTHTGLADEIAAAGNMLVDAAAMALTLQAIPAPRLNALITSFLDQGPETVQRLRAAVRDAQLLDLRVHAHAAKGAALNLGLTGLAQTAQALQDGAAHLPAHEIARLVQRFETQVPATRLAVRAALNQAAGRPAELASDGYTMMGSGSSLMPKRP
jgi:signal transduction histidine kinase/DNA-binding response OmpR family regulator